MSKKSRIMSPRAESPEVLLPEVSALVPAGFPSPADDYLDRTLDLNEYLIHNQAASFFIRVAGESMQGAGILPGDILLVDRSVEPAHNKIVVAVLDDEMVVKRLRYRQGRGVLVPEHPGFRPIEITDAMEAHIWGVVTAVIRKLG
ncbi:Peptidase S24/S26A/S26B, conserved region [Desulfonatronospira thiodismutans ASO3-1]|uniref:Peptidase S24/S26A/S26B, conserved region n=1 Tax=Desulfonatronospira thiodismutans ASO3-1 TaxID=555779 RepID=D6SQB8_9BACT|nr:MULTISPECIES: translesion error-prone DNA polymerase V autoproteolytic subunit [Desulfonatronospira]EFI34944.1 Peptidase S24/S26A/S26B, conserved region [Desulfonatronospira thiodismutans ASO3-1]RQD74064.1 MAG: error-prone repair protein UmuD [Desulfonatronospira sp. MSAO_Bac3]